MSSHKSSSLFSLFACGILISSGITSYFSYQSLTERENQTTAIPGLFTLGKQQYRLWLTSTQSPPQCLGSIASSFQKQGLSHFFTASGKLRFQFRGTSFEPGLEAQAAFSEIDQLGASMIRITLPGIQVSMGTTGIDPILFRVRSVLHGATYSQETSLPGPIELQSLDEASFTIRYRYVGGLTKIIRESIPISQQTPSFLPSLRLETCKDLCDCSASPTDPPELSPLFSSFARVPFLDILLNGFQKSL